MSNKVFIKGLVAAGVAAAMSVPSISAFAMRLSEPGEAQLVPFVVYDDNPFPDVEGVEPFSVNTVVKITVPKSVGNDVIPNFYTATHTTPTNSPDCATQPGNPLLTGCEYPAWAALDPSNTIHWYFLDRYSEKKADGTIPVTPDDVAVIDWGAKLRQTGNLELEGVPGYLVLTTQAGSRGNDADFSFFAEAWAFFGLDAGNGTIGLIDALIPTLALNDGADTIGDTTPTLDNNVIELNQSSPIASPLVTGIRTNWSDGNPTDIKVIDLTLGNRSIPIADVVNPFQFPTLMVVWNDRNAGNWNSVSVEVFNDQEEHCSGNIALPYQLNLVWVQTDVTAGNTEDATGLGAWPVPGFITENKTLCVPPEDSHDGTNFDRLLSGGFVKIYLPEPVDNGIFAPESAMAAFSIPLQYTLTYETVTVPDDNDEAVTHFVLTDLSLIPFETALGHDRGMFNRVP
jgi:hypothetical protein